MDTKEPAGIFAWWTCACETVGKKHTRGALLDFGAYQLCALQDDHLEVRDDSGAKFHTFEQSASLSPHPTHRTHQMALRASIASSLYDLL